LSSIDPSPPAGPRALPPTHGGVTMRAYPGIIANYLEEVGFLEVQRRGLLFSHEIGVAELREHEERIEAQLAGLRQAGDQILDQIQEGLQSGEPWVIYACARAWMEVVRPDAGALAAMLGGVAVEELPAWVEALRGAGLPIDSCPEALIPRAAVVQSAPWCGPISPMILDACARAESPLLRAAAARAIGAGMGQAACLNALMDDDDPGVRARALWGICLVNPEAAAGRLRARITSTPETFAVRALGYFGEKGDMSLLCNLCGGGEMALRAAAIRALGDLGFPGTLEFLMGQMVPEEPIMQAIADAFSTMTGETVPDLEDLSTTLHASRGGGAEEPVAGGGQRADARIRRGRPFQDGDDMEGMWRKSLYTAGDDLRWLRREVPAGFFNADPSDEMQPGE